MPKRKKLPKRARHLFDMLECQIEACCIGPPISAQAIANSIVMILAGSLSLDPELHEEFARANYVAPREAILKIKGIPSKLGYFDKLVDGGDRSDKKRVK